MGTVPDILGLVWPNFSPNAGSKSQISGRILKSFRGHFDSAERLLFQGRASGAVVAKTDLPAIHVRCVSPSTLRFSKKSLEAWAAGGLRPEGGQTHVKMIFRHIFWDARGALSL